MTRRWAWVAVLVGGVVLFEIVRRVLIRTENPNLVPSLILLGAAVAPATFVVFILGRRLPYDISGGAIGVVAFLSGIVCCRWWLSDSSRRPRSSSCRRSC